MDIKLRRFFLTEMYDEMYNEIIHFLSSQEIREGIFEGNEVLINKINRDTAIIYFEYQLHDGKFRYSDDAIIVHIPLLLNELKQWKETLT